MEGKALARTTKATHFISGYLQVNKVTSVVGKNSRVRVEIARGAGSLDH